MEAPLSLDRETNNRQTYPDRGPKLTELISMVQGYQVVPLDPDDTMSSPFCACRSLVRATNSPFYHSLLQEK